MTYDQSNDPRDGDYDPKDDASELDLVYDQLLAAQKTVRALRSALETILMIHDGNQPPALNMPDLDYARRTIRDIHFRARDALERC